MSDGKFKQKLRNREPSDALNLENSDYWFKVTGMFEHAWAIIDKKSECDCTIYFINQSSIIYDCIEIQSIGDAEAGLTRNGFELYSDNPAFQQWQERPEPPFNFSKNAMHPVYSSGEYWLEK